MAKNDCLARLGGYVTSNSDAEKGQAQTSKPRLLIWMYLALSFKEV